MDRSNFNITRPENLTLDDIFSEELLEELVETFEKTNDEKVIEDAIIDELYMVDIVPTGVVSIPSLTIRSSKLGDEEWEIQVDGVVTTTIVKKGLFSPTVMVKSSGTFTRERPVINGKIPASSVKIDEDNSDLPNPRLSTLGLSKDEISNIKKSYRDWETDRKSTRLNSSHSAKSRMPSSA